MQENIHSLTGKRNKSTYVAAEIFNQVYQEPSKSFIQYLFKIGSFGAYKSWVIRVFKADMDSVVQA